MQIELRYSNSERDIEKYLNYFELSTPVRSQKRTLFLRYQFFAIIISGMGIMSEGLVAGIGVFALLNIVYVFWIRPREFKKMLDESRNNLHSGLAVGQKKKVVIDKESLSCIKDCESIKLDWDVISRVVDNDGDLYFFSGDLLRALIPARSFKNESDFHHVQEIIRSKKVEEKTAACYA